MQDGGGNPTASQRKEIAEQETFVEELRAFREEVARVAPLWNPDLNDGVIINFSPLWRLVPRHRAWQRECKDCWDKLVAGDYDWAHLAMHLWPERVVPKCAKDRSLAIAHGLEDVFWEEKGHQSSVVRRQPEDGRQASVFSRQSTGESSVVSPQSSASSADDRRPKTDDAGLNAKPGKWTPRKVPQHEIDRLIAERTSAAVKDALKSLLEAPAPAGTRVRGSGRRRVQGSGSTRGQGSAEVVPSSELLKAEP